MAQEFQGRIELDIRDSVPDREPFLALRAPKGAPNHEAQVRGWFLLD